MARSLSLWLSLRWVGAHLATVGFLWCGITFADEPNDAGVTPPSDQPREATPPIDEATPPSEPPHEATPKKHKHESAPPSEPAAPPAAQKKHKKLELTGRIFVRTAAVKTEGAPKPTAESSLQSARA